MHHLMAFGSLLSSSDGQNVNMIFFYFFFCGYHGCLRALASLFSAVKEIAARLSVHMCWSPDC